MSIWMAKAMVQKTISYLPFKHQFNYFFQQYVTKGVRLSDYLFDDKLVHAQSHIKAFDQFATSSSKRALELGSGWYPIVPIALFLKGFDEIISIDIEPLMTIQNAYNCIEKFKAYHKANQLEKMIGAINPDRMAKLEQIATNIDSLSNLLAQMHISIRVEDARHTSFAADSFDLIHSNNTFEHIPKNILRDILKEFKRILRPEGVMSHFIDMSDHFAHFDKKISIYHFLQYSESAWSWIDNSIQPQNRLRYSDYIDLYNEQQLKMVASEEVAGDLKALQAQKLDKQFANYALSDLAISHCLLVSKK